MIWLSGYNLLSGEAKGFCMCEKGQGCAVLQSFQLLIRFALQQMSFHSHRSSFEEEFLGKILCLKTYLIF